ncbi:O-antigen polymerase [Megasphaera sp.]|uniref:O-antigen polymerase n=1 Tax=Megasphaera sp. TaxID=2023260 RepID=UPI00351F9425
MLIFLLLFFEIVLLFISFFGCGRDLLAPSVVFCGMFVLSTIFATLNIFTWNIDYSIDAVLIISLGIFSFILAEISMRLLKNSFCHNIERKEEKSFSFHPIHIKWAIMLLFIVFNILISFWYYKEISRIVGASGYFEGSLLHSFRVVSTESSFANNDSLALNPLLNQCLKIVVANSYVFLYFFIRNFFIGKEKNEKVYSFLLVSITALIPSILSGARGSLLQFLSAALVYSYITWHQIYGWNINISRKIICRGILYFIVGIPVFYYSTFWLGREINLDLFSYISNYIGGSIQLFNLYMQDYDSLPQYFGEESLISLCSFLNKFGADIPIISLHLEPRGLTIGTIGNVYTFFRRPLHDFGIFGMITFTYIVGLLFSFIYEIKVKGKFGEKTVSSILIYGYLFYWVVIGSIDQWSQSVISMTNLMEIIFMVIIYKILTKVRIRI